MWVIHYNMQFFDVNVLSSAAVITTIFQYLSGALSCIKYIRNRSTGDSSCFPFICGFLSCSLWLKYAILANENAVIVVNSIGATLFFSYVIIFWVYTINKRAICKQLLGVIIILITTILYTQFYEKDPNEATKVIGYLCCLVTVVFFAAPCCMLMQVIRLKTTEMLPFPLILMSFLVSIQWSTYGFAINDHFLAIPNVLGALLSGVQLALCAIYPSKPRTTALGVSSAGDVPYAIFN